MRLLKVEVAVCIVKYKLEVDRYDLVCILMKKRLRQVAIVGNYM